MVHMKKDKDFDSPLNLEDYMSYDEIAVSALLGVSCPSCIINNGARNNSGRDGKKGSYETEAEYIALVGTRFENHLQMANIYCIVKKWTSAMHKQRNSSVEEFNAMRECWGKLFDEPTLPTITDVRKYAETNRMHMIHGRTGR